MVTVGAGDYTVTVTDDKGCTSTCDYHVSENPNPSCSIMGASEICKGESATLTVLGSGGTGLLTYEWNVDTDGDGNNETSTVVTVGAGNYTVTVTDAKGCYATCNYHVAQNPKPTCSISGDSEVCEGGSAELTVSGSGGTGILSYEWNVDTDGDGSNETSTVVTVSAGTYTVTVTDDKGCSSTCHYTVTEYPDPTCMIYASSDDDCDGATVLLEVIGMGGTPGYTYQWKRNGSVIAGAVNDSYLVTSGGTYSVVITDSKGCTSECNYVVNEECGTSWAYLKDKSVCFNELDKDCRNAGQLQWGFTTPITPGSYTFDLLEGAPGLCQTTGSTGDLVGTVEVNYVAGMEPEIIVETTDGDHFLSEVHVWIGCTPLPKKRSRCIAAPGQFPCGYDINNEANYTVDDCSGDCLNSGQIWIAIHAVTCDLECVGPAAKVTQNSSSDNPLAKEEEPIIDRTWVPLQLEAYPNPTSHRMFIDIQGLQKGETILQVFDLMGREIKRFELEGSTTEKIDWKLPLGIRTGVYHIMLKNNSQLISHPILIIRVE